MPAKRTSPGAAATTGAPDGRRDVDPAVLARRVGVGADAVGRDHLPATGQAQAARAGAATSRRASEGERRR